MKKNHRIALLISLATLITTSTSAQKKWSAGIRAGVEIINYQITTEDFRADNYLLNKQIFINKTIGRRFELELTLNHNNKDYGFGSTMWGSTDSSRTTAVQNNLSLGIAAKYYIYSRKRLSLYGTAGTTFAFVDDKSNTTFYQPNTPPQHGDHKESYVSLFHRGFFGLGINYNITRSIYFNGNMLVSYKIDGINQPGNSYFNRWTNGVFVGAGYRF